MMKLYIGVNGYVEATMNLTIEIEHEEDGGWNAEVMEYKEIIKYHKSSLIVTNRYCLNFWYGIPD